MKKTITSATLLTIMATTAIAQGFYFKAGLGYAFPSGGQSMYDTPIPYNGFPTGYNGSRNNVGTIETYSIKGASFSSGVPLTLGVGYMINEHVGVQLDAGIGLSAKKYTFTDNNVSLNTTAGPIPYNISTIQQANTPFLMMPSLVLQTGNTWKVYSRMGLVLPLSTKVTQDQVLSNAPGTGAVQTDDFTWQIKNSFSLGFAAAAGLKYQISDRASVWFEMSVLSLSVYTKEQNLTSWTESYQGASQSLAVSSYTNSSPNIKFSKSAKVDSTYANLPTYSMPFSNVGFNVGFTFSLSKNGGSSGRRRENEDIDPNKPFRRR